MFSHRDASGETPGSTSAGLVAGVQQGDPEAWKRLARVYAPLVYHWCRRRGLQASDAEDVVQNVFLTVAKRIAEFRRDRPGDSFRGWLWGITRNKLGDWLRTQKDKAKPLEEIAAPEPDPDAPEMMGPLCRRALDVICGEFEDRSWQAFWQVVVEGRMPADAAADVGLTCNAVYIAKSRILRRLRQVLEED